MHTLFFPPLEGLPMIIMAHTVYVQYMCALESQLLLNYTIG